MTLSESVIRDAKARGVSLWAEGDILRYRGDKAAIDSILQDLKRHKSEILALLRVKTGEINERDFEIVTFESFTLRSGRRVAFKLAIPKDKYDGIELLRMLETFNQSTNEKPE